jgi:branched-chain amino acid transport system ATP-binding protein
MSETKEALLSVRGLEKKFGGFTALKSFDLDIKPGERIGVIGPNGAGKSTLVNSLTGSIRADAGKIVLDGKIIDNLAAHKRARMGLMRSFQLPRPFKSMSVIENILVPIAYARPSLDGKVYDLTQAQDEAREILQAIGLGKKADLPAMSLTQVDMRKLELARAMAANPEFCSRMKQWRGFPIAKSMRFWICCSPSTSMAWRL